MIIIREIFKFFFDKILTLSSVNFLNFIVTILSISIIVKFLGPIQWGKFVLIQLWPNYLGMLCLWSFNNNEVREISSQRNSKNNINKIFSESFIIQFSLLIFSILVASLITSFFKLIQVNLIGFIGLSLMIIGHASQFHWILNGLEKIWQAAFFQLIPKIIILIFVSLIFYENYDYNKLLLIFGIGTTLSNLVCLIYIFKNLKIKLINFSFVSVIKRFKFGFLYFFISIVGNFKNLVFPIAINFFLGEYYVGLFSVLERIKSIIVQISQPITNSLYPRISYLNIENLKKANIFRYIFFIILVLLILPFVIVLIIFPEFILLNFAGQQFLELKSELQLIAILAFMNVFTEYFYYQNILSFNLRKKLLIYNFGGFILVAISNLFLLDAYLIYGAIISLFILEFFNILLLLLYKEK